MGGRITREYVDRVRDAADIVRVISDYVALKQNGTRFKGLCPFHQEKTPSFSVDPDRKLFYCFGCQTGGDLFQFVTEYDGVSFPDAVESLAERFGVPLPETRERTPEDAWRDRMFEIHRAADAYFRGVLAQDSGRGCRDYLTRRDLDDATVERLGLGYAPDGWQNLLDHLASKRFSPHEIVRAGLAIPRKSGSGQYDRFRDRLTFPIRDTSGRVIAFGGRILGDGEPKYLNSPETALYVKGDHLYGLDLARDAIRREGFAVVVEGYMDLAALARAGVLNAVASLGTAFTPNQARLLTRYTRRVVVSYDGDAAGSSAAVKSFDLLLEHGLDVHVVDLPDGLDPDDYIRAHGADAYRVAVRGAPGYLDYLVNRAIRGRDLSRPQDKVAVVDDVLPHIARLGNAIERVAWADRLADLLRIEDDLVKREVRKALREGNRTMRRSAPSADRELTELEAHLILLLLDNADGRATLLDEIGSAGLPEESPVRAIVDAVRGLHEAGAAIGYQEVFQTLPDERDRDVLTRVAFRDESLRTESAVEGCLQALRRNRLKREKNDLDARIRANADPALLDTMMRRQMELAREIASLS